jgi:hypothetical protein
VGGPQRRTGWGAWLALAAVLALPASADAAPLLPDLVADPPVGGNAPVTHTDAAGTRLLLRFDGFVHNRGPGALEIRGSDPADGAMGTVRQRVYDDAGGFADRSALVPPTLLYETDDDHDHWHLRNAMRYSLWSEDRAAEVAPAQKVGFCFVDTEPVEAPASASPVYTERASGFCRSGEPGAPEVAMGISPGWRDVYSYVLAFQWIDISDVAPGRYRLRADADPDGVIEEAGEANDGAFDSELSIVNGHRAAPVDAGVVDAAAPTRIQLEAETFDDVHLDEPGPREFQVVAPPSGGTLDRPAGTWFSADSVVYTPNPGFSGADSFTVAARDAASPFPRNPPAAAVTLRVDAPAEPPGPGVLGISGAPARMRASTSVQLTASGPGAEQGLTWSVDGVPGDSNTAGTISETGRYRAPATPPAGGSVTVRATSATGAVGEVAIRIVAAPEPRPAPGIKPPPVPRRGLSRIKLRLHERTLLAAVSSAQAGRVRLAAARGGRRFGGCAARVRRGGAAVCAMRVPDGVTRGAFLCRISRRYEALPRGIVVRASLFRHGERVAVRRAALR